MGAYPVIGVVNVGEKKLGYWEVYPVSFVREVTSPYSTTDNLMALAIPAGVETETTLDGSVSAAAGSTATSSITKTFTLNDKRPLCLEGTLFAFLSLKLALADVDATYAGTAELTTVEVDVISYDAASATATTVANTIKTLDVSLTGTAATSKSWIEVVGVDVPRTSFGNGNYLQVKVTVNFSATTNASATVETEANASLFLDGSSVVYLPVV